MEFKTVEEVIELCKDENERKLLNDMAPQIRLMLAIYLGHKEESDRKQKRDKATAFIRAFSKGADYDRSTASKMFNKVLKETPGYEVYRRICADIQTQPEIDIYESAKKRLHDVGMGKVSVSTPFQYKDKVVFHDVEAPINTQVDALKTLLDHQVQLEKLKALSNEGNEQLTLQVPMFINDTRGE